MRADLVFPKSKVIYLEMLYACNRGIRSNAVADVACTSEFHHRPFIILLLSFVPVVNSSRGVAGSRIWRKYACIGDLGSP